MADAVVVNAIRDAVLEHGSFPNADPSFIASEVSKWAGTIIDAGFVIVPAEGHCPECLVAPNALHLPTCVFHPHWDGHRV